MEHLQDDYRATGERLGTASVKSLSSGLEALKQGLKGVVQVGQIRLIQ